MTPQDRRLQRLRINWRIYLPLAGPALTALAVFVFMYSVDDLLTPLIYLSDPDKFTLTVGWHSSKGRGHPWNLIMAAPNQRLADSDHLPRRATILRPGVALTGSRAEPGGPTARRRSYWRRA